MRGFKGIWVPKEVWLSKDLSLIEKIFLVEIDSLDNEDGCFASNSHFSDFFDISKGRCTQIIKSLEAKGLVKIELKREGKQIVKRVIKVVNKLNTPSENIKQGCLENAQGSNTKSNNTKTKEPPVRKKTKTDFSDDDLKFAEWMFGKIRELNPDHKKPDLKSWARHVRLARERDGRTHRQLGELYGWVHSKNEFWRKQILSTKNLRDKFDRLTLERKESENNTGNNKGPNNSATRLHNRLKERYAALGETGEESSTTVF